MQNRKRAEENYYIYLVLKNIYLEMQSFKEYRDKKLASFHHLKAGIFDCILVHREIKSNNLYRDDGHRIIFNTIYHKSC